MRDVYLWTGYALGAVIVAAILAAILTWLFRRKGRAEAAEHHSWWEGFDWNRAEDQFEVRDEAYTFKTSEFERVFLNDVMRSEPSWAGRAFADCLVATRDEHLEEFAGPTHATAARIWAEVDGIFTAKGLRTA